MKGTRKDSRWKRLRNCVVYGSLVYSGLVATETEGGKMRGETESGRRGVGRSKRLFAETVTLVIRSARLVIFRDSPSLSLVVRSLPRAPLIRNFTLRV